MQTTHKFDDIEVDSLLYAFLAREALPGTELDSAAFFAGFAALVRRHGHFLACALAPADLPALGKTLRGLGDDRLLFTLDPALAVKRIRSRTGADNTIEKFEREAFLREVDGIFRLLAK